MRIPRTASAYLARQVLGWGAIGLASITILFLSQNLVRMLDKLLLFGVHAAGVATVVKCIAVTMLAHTVPIAFLFGVLVTVGRMAADGEILALRSCGFGLREILLPILVLAIAISAATAWLLLDVENRARRELRSAVIEMTTQGEMIAPGEFTRVGDRIVYVRSRDGGLIQLDNVLWTPHLGAVTLEASERGEWGAAAEVIRVLESKRPKNPVVDADEARLLLPA